MTILSINYIIVICISLCCLLAVIQPVDGQSCLAKDFKLDIAYMSSLTLNCVSGTTPVGASSCSKLMYLQDRLIPYVSQFWVNFLQAPAEVTYTSRGNTISRGTASTVDFLNPGNDYKLYFGGVDSSVGPGTSVSCNGVDLFDALKSDNTKYFASLPPRVPANVDFVLFVAVNLAPTCTAIGTFSRCSRSTLNGRPTSAMATFCLNALDNNPQVWTNQYSQAMRLFNKIFGFATQDIAYFFVFGRGDTCFEPNDSATSYCRKSGYKPVKSGTLEYTFSLKPQTTNIYTINTPNLLNAAKSYYQLTTMTGFDMIVKSPDGISFLSRLVGPEVGSDSFVPGLNYPVSVFSVAYYADSNWYCGPKQASVSNTIAEVNAPHSLSYGRGQGVELITNNKCVSPNEVYLADGSTLAHNDGCSPDGTTRFSYNVASTFSNTGNCASTMAPSLPANTDYSVAHCPLFLKHPDAKCFRGSGAITQSQCYRIKCIADGWYDVFKDATATTPLHSCKAGNAVTFQDPVTFINYRCSEFIRFCPAVKTGCSQRLTCSFHGKCDPAASASTPIAYCSSCDPGWSGAQCESSLPFVTSAIVKPKDASESVNHVMTITFNVPVYFGAQKAPNFFGANCFYGIGQSGETNGKSNGDIQKCEWDISSSPEPKIDSRVLAVEVKLLDNKDDKNRNANANGLFGSLGYQKGLFLRLLPPDSSSPPKYGYRTTCNYPSGQVGCPTYNIGERFLPVIKSPPSKMARPVQGDISNTQSSITIKFTPPSDNGGDDLDGYCIQIKNIPECGRRLLFSVVNNDYIDSMDDSNNESIPIISDAGIGFPRQDKSDDSTSVDSCGKPVTTRVDVAGKNILSYTITGLATATNYAISIRARNLGDVQGSCSSELSDSATLSTTQRTIGPVKNITPSTVAETSITLRWDAPTTIDNEYVSQYRVWYYDTSFSQGFAVDKQFKLESTSGDCTCFVAGNSRGRRLSETASTSIDFDKRRRLIDDCIGNSAAVAGASAIRCMKIAGLVSGHTYNFQIQALSSANSIFGDNSVISTPVKTLSPPAAPSTPSLQSQTIVTPNTSPITVQVTLSISPPSDTGSSAISQVMILWAMGTETMLDPNTNPSCNAPNSVIDLAKRCYKQTSFDAGSILYSLTGFVICSNIKFAVVMKNSNNDRWSALSPLLQQTLYCTPATMNKVACATPAQANAIAVSWTAPVNANGSITKYRLRWTSSAASPPAFTDVSTNPTGSSPKACAEENFCRIVASGTSNTITNLLKNKPYYFKISAANDVVSTQWGQESEFMMCSTIPTVPGQPVAPVLSGTATATQLVLSISFPSDLGGSVITGYQIDTYNALNIATSLSSLSTTDTVINNPHLVTMSVQPSSSYKFRVKARNAQGLSEQSPPSVAMDTPQQLSTDPVSQIFKPVVSATVAPTATEITVTWTATKMNTGYVLVQQRLTWWAKDATEDVDFDQGQGSISGVRDIDKSKTEYKATGLAPGQIYVFCLYANTKAATDDVTEYFPDEGAAISKSAEIRTSCAIPAAPASFKDPKNNSNVGFQGGDRGVSSITVRWNPSPDIGGVTTTISSYVVVMKLVSESSYPSDTSCPANVCARLTAPNPPTSYTFTTGADGKPLTRFTNYEFQVRVVNSCSRSSAPLQFQPIMSLAGRPIMAAVTIDNVLSTSFRVNWKQPSDGGGDKITKFQLKHAVITKRRLLADVIADFAPNVLEATITNYQPGQYVVVFIRATNADSDINDVPFSDPTYVTLGFPTPPQVTGLTQVSEGTTGYPNPVTSTVATIISWVAPTVALDASGNGKIVGYVIQQHTGTDAFVAADPQYTINKTSGDKCQCVNSNSGTCPIVPQQTGTNVVTCASIISLVPGTTYSFRVAAVTSYSTTPGPWSSRATTNTGLQITMHLVPSAPLNLVLDMTDGRGMIPGTPSSTAKFWLNYNTPSNFVGSADTIDNYVVLFRVDGGAYISITSVPTDNSLLTSQCNTISTLSANKKNCVVKTPGSGVSDPVAFVFDSMPLCKTYYFKMIAKSKFSPWSPFSNELTVRTLCQATSPGTPTNVAPFTANSLSVTWTAPVEAASASYFAVVTYRLYVRKDSEQGSIDGSCPAAKCVSVSAATTGGTVPTSYTLTNLPPNSNGKGTRLSPNTKYCFTVTANNVGFTSTFTTGQEACFTTSSNSLPPPAAEPPSKSSTVAETATTISIEWYGPCSVSLGGNSMTGDSVGTGSSVAVRSGSSSGAATATYDCSTMPFPVISQFNVQYQVKDDCDEGIAFSSDLSNLPTVTVAAASGDVLQATTITSLVASKCYRFRVSAKNDYDWGPYSDWSDDIATKDPPPNISPPSGFTAPTCVTASITKNSIKVNWSPPTSGGNLVTDYEVTFWQPTGEEKRRALSTDFSNSAEYGDVIVSASGGAAVPTTYTFTGLKVGQMYNFRLRGKNSASGYVPSDTNLLQSVTVSCTTLSTSPSAPASITVTAGTSVTQATVTWSAAASSGSNAASCVVSYNVQFCTDSTFALGSCANNIKLKLTVLTVSITSLTRNSQYYFRVNSVNNIIASPSAWTASSAFTTGVTEPSKMHSVTFVSSTTNSITVAWAAPSDLGNGDGTARAISIDSYLVNYTTEVVCTVACVSGSVTMPGTVTSLSLPTDSNALSVMNAAHIKPGTNYFFTVRARNNLLTSYYHASDRNPNPGFSTLFLKPSKPGIPTIYEFPSVDTTNNPSSTIQLMWDIPSIPGFTLQDYMIQYRSATQIFSTSERFYTIIATRTTTNDPPPNPCPSCFGNGCASATTLTCTTTNCELIRCARITGLTPGEQYFFQVSASNQKRRDSPVYENYSDVSQGYRMPTVPSQPQTPVLVSVVSTNPAPAPPSPPTVDIAVTWAPPTVIGGASILKYVAVWTDASCHTSLPDLTDASWLAGAGACSDPNYKSSCTIPNCYRFSPSTTGSQAITFLQFPICGTFTLRVAAQNKLPTWSSYSSVLVVTSPCRPSTPGVPTLASNTFSSLSLTWNPPTIVGGGALVVYELRSRLSTVETYAPTTACPSDSCFTITGTPATAAYTVSGLAKGISYYFKVRARNDAVSLFSDFSGESTICTTLRTVPDAPGAPTTDGGRGPTTLGFQWTVPATGGSPITSYDYTITPVKGTVNDDPTVLEATCSDPLENAGSPTTMNIIAPTTGTNVKVKVTVPNLSQGIYVLRVRANNAIGPGEWSGQSACYAVDKDAPQPPGKPESYAITSTSISVKWKAPTKTGTTPIKFYELSWSTSKTAFDVADVATKLDVSTTSHTVTGLIKGTTYYMYVKANNYYSGYGDPSPLSDPMTTLTTPPDAPDRPTADGSQALSRQVTIAWTGPTNTGGAPIVEFTTCYSNPPSTARTCLPRPYPEYSKSKVYITLTRGNTYCFSVAARNAGNLNFGEYSANTDPCIYIPYILPTAPGAPTLVSQTLGPSAITVKWTQPSDTGGASISKYNLQYRDKSNQSDNPWLAVTTTTDTGTATVDITKGATYEFMVAAQNTAVSSYGPNSGPSLGIVATISAPNRPGAPTFTATDATSIGVKWTPPSDRGGVGVSLLAYDLQWRISTQSTYSSENHVQITSSGSDPATSYTVTSLRKGTAYVFSVRAQNNVVSEFGEYSFESSITEPLATTKLTRPSPPGMPTLASATSTTLTVTWPLSSDTGGSPIVEHFIFYRLSSEAAYSSTSNFKTGSGSNVGTISGLTKGTSYVMKVQCKNLPVSDYSDFSVESNVLITSYTVPNAPGTPDKSIIRETSLVIVFPAPTDTGGLPISDCIVQYTSDPTGQFSSNSPTVSVAVAALDIDNPVVQVSIPNLTAGVSYYTRAACRNDGLGSSAFGPYSGKSASIRTFTNPSAPGVPSSTDQHPTSLTLTWRQPTDLGGTIISQYYVIYRLSSGTYDETITATIATVTSSDLTVNAPTTATIANLAKGTYYNFKVRAQSLEVPTRYGPYSSESVNIQTAYSGPDVMASAPTFISSTDTTMTIQWQPPSDNGGASLRSYKIQVKVFGASSYDDSLSLVIDDASATPNPETSITFKNLPKGLAYIFHVASKNTIFNSWSDYGPENVIKSGSTNFWTKYTVPSNPSSISVDSKTDQTISMSWTAPTDTGGAKEPISMYQISWIIDGKSNVIGSQSLSGSILYYEITGLSQGVTYVVSITARNAKITTNPDGPPAVSPPIRTVTAPSAPGQPSLNEVPTGPYSIRIAWTTPTDDGGSPIQSYYISYRWTTRGLESGTTVGTSSIIYNVLQPVPSNNVLLISSLSKGTHYFFTIYASNALLSQQRSPPSPESSGFQTIITVPNAPTLRLPIPLSSGTEIDLGWDAPTDDGGSDIANYYVVYTSNYGIYNPSNAVSLPKTLKATVSGLSKGIIYWFKVQAKNIAIPTYGPFSAESSGVRTSYTVPGTPGKPVAMAVTETTVTVRWTPATDTGGSPVIQYRALWRFTTTSYSEAAIQLLPIITDFSSIVPYFETTITGLTPGAHYIFQSSARNGQVTEWGPGLESIDTRTLIHPSAPSQPVLISRTDTQLVVGWGVPTDFGGASIENYLVQWRTANGLYNAGNQRVISGSLTYITLNGLIPGEYYYFIVFAKNALVTSYSPSSIESPRLRTFRVPTAPPSAPLLTNIRAMDGDVQWAEPVDNGDTSILGYMITFLPQYIKNPINIDVETPSNTTSFHVLTLKPMTDYLAKVKAKNKIGYGVYGPLTTVTIQTLTHPTAVIILPSFATYCDDMLIDGRQSYASDKAPVRAWQWTVTTNTGITIQSNNFVENSLTGDRLTLLSSSAFKLMPTDRSAMILQISLVVIDNYGELSDRVSKTLTLSFVRLRAIPDSNNPTKNTLYMAAGLSLNLTAEILTLDYNCKGSFQAIVSGERSSLWTYALLSGNPSGLQTYDFVATKKYGGTTVLLSEPSLSVKGGALLKQGETYVFTIITYQTLPYLPIAAGYAHITIARNIYLNVTGQIFTALQSQLTSSLSDLDNLEQAVTYRWIPTGTSWSPITADYVRNSTGSMILFDPSIHKFVDGATYSGSLTVFKGNRKVTKEFSVKAVGCDIRNPANIRLVTSIDPSGGDFNAASVYGFQMAAVVQRYTCGILNKNQNLITQNQVLAYSWACYDVTLSAPCDVDPKVAYIFGTNRQSLIVRKSVFPVLSTYRFTYTVTDINSGQYAPVNTADTSTSIRVFVDLSNLGLVLSGGDKTINISDKLSLQLLVSDPDNSEVQLSYSWSASSSVASAASTILQTVTQDNVDLTGTNLGLGIHQIRVDVKKGPRSSWTYCTVQVVTVGALSVSMQVFGLFDKFQKFDRSQQLQINVNVDGVIDSSIPASYSWSSKITGPTSIRPPGDAPSTTSRLSDGTFQYVIAPDNLVASMNYGFTFQVTLPNGRMGIASRLIQVNRPPRVATSLVVTPVEGEAMVTPFTIVADGYDDDGLVLYRYGYLDPIKDQRAIQLSGGIVTNLAHPLYLAEPSFSNVAVFPLPRGDKNSVLIIVVEVTDVFGARTLVSTSVLVRPVSTSAVVAGANVISESINTFNVGGDARSVGRYVNAVATELNRSSKTAGINTVGAQDMRSLMMSAIRSTTSVPDATPYFLESIAVNIGAVSAVGSQLGLQPLSDGSTVINQVLNSDKSQLKNLIIDLSLTLDTNVNAAVGYLLASVSSVVSQEYKASNKTSVTKENVDQLRSSLDAVSNGIYRSLLLIGMDRLSDSQYMSSYTRRTSITDLQDQFWKLESVRSNDDDPSVGGVSSTSTPASVKLPDVTAVTQQSTDLALVAAVYRSNPYAYMLGAGKINSNIVSVKFKSKTATDATSLDVELTVKNLKKPLMVVISNVIPTTTKTSTSDSKCGWMNEVTQRWESSGCFMASYDPTGSSIACVCSHATDFGAVFSPNAPSFGVLDPIMDASVIGRANVENLIPLFIVAAIWLTYIILRIVIYQYERRLKQTEETQLLWEMQNLAEKHGPPGGEDCMLVTLKNDLSDQQFIDISASESGSQEGEDDTLLSGRRAYRTTLGHRQWLNYADKIGTLDTDELHRMEARTIGDDLHTGVTRTKTDAEFEIQNHSNLGSAPTAARVGSGEGVSDPSRLTLVQRLHLARLTKFWNSNQIDKNDVEKQTDNGVDSSLKDTTQYRKSSFQQRLNSRRQGNNGGVITSDPDNDGMVDQDDLSNFGELYDHNDGDVVTENMQTLTKKKSEINLNDDAVPIVDTVTTPVVTQGRGLRRFRAAVRRVMMLKQKRRRGVKEWLRAYWSRISQRHTVGSLFRQRYNDLARSQKLTIVTVVVLSCLGIMAFLLQDVDAIRNFNFFVWLIVLLIGVAVMFPIDIIAYFPFMLLSGRPRPLSPFERFSLGAGWCVSFILMVIFSYTTMIYGTRFDAVLIIEWLFFTAIVLAIGFFVLEPLKISFWYWVVNQTRREEPIAAVK